MDSRIREIEQWVAEAKEDLGECGQEAYIRKLYLLDAEIRAIIKENGILPGASSPQPRQTRQVRRFTVPALAFSGVLSVLLLAATTVYFIQPLLLSRNPATEAPRRVVAGFVPSAITGELILADNGIPLNLAQGSLLADIPLAAQFASEPQTITREPEAALSAPVSSGASPVLLASAPVANSEFQNVAPRGGGQSVAAGTGEEAINVMLGNMPQPAAPRTPPTLNNSGAAPSVGFDGLVPQVARLEFTDRFTVPEPSADRVNSVKTQLNPRGDKPTGGNADTHGVHVDKSTKVAVDSVDNSSEEGKATEPEKDGQTAE